MNLRDLTPEVLEFIGTHAQKQPSNPEVLFGIHELRSDAPREPALGTILDTRCPHFLIEIIPLALSPEVLAEGVAWGLGFIKALRETDPTNIVPATYISLTPAKDIAMSTIYESCYEILKNVKEKYDPQNVFNNALPRF